MKTAKIVILACLLLPALFASVAAQNNLSGYWEGAFGGSRVNDEHPWNLWRPNQLFEFDFTGNVAEGAEVRLKFGARWDRDNSPELQPGFLFREGHLKYRHDESGRGFEALIFARERRFWVGNHLLNLIDENSVSSDNNAQGYRLDGWRDDWNVTYILSDFSNQEDHSTPELEGTDDAHIVRLTRRFGDKGSYFGGTYLRKNYGKVDSLYSKQFNEVRSADFQWITDAVDFSAEFADTRVPAEDIPNDGWHKDAWKYGKLGQSLDRFFPRNTAFRAEFRNVTVGNHRYGHYTITGGYWNIGSDYRNYQGSDATNRIGHFFHTFYRVPQRAVTYTLSTGAERLRASKLFAFDGDDRPLYTSNPRSWLNQNLYVEFINGFKFSFSHNRAEDRFNGRDYKHHDWVFELIVENRLAWMKTQFKIKDWDTQQEKRIFGLETTINLTGSLKWYNRYLVADDAIEARSMLFTQLQYRPHDNVEVLFGYGPENYGDWGELTNDADFETGGKMRDEFKLLLKTWF